MCPQPRKAVFASEPEVLLHAHFMIRKQLHCSEIQRPHDGRESGQHFRRVVVRGYEGNPDDNRDIGSYNSTKIVQYEIIISAGEATMQLCVRMLQVEVNEVQEWQYSLPVLPRRETTRLDRGMNALLSTDLQYLPGEDRLRERFAAAQRDPSFGDSVVERVPCNGAHYLFDSDFLADNFFLWFAKGLLLRELILRIAAPLTPKRTPFHKNDGPDPWSVMDSEPFDLRDHSTGDHFSFRFQGVLRGATTRNARFGK